jgi:CII-binding regulator of phage lambda lysogenization HflD
MADVIDDLKVQIDASTNSADAKIDKFIQKMMSLQSAISGIEMSGASQVASGINQIASSIQSFNERTKTADFSRITTGLNKLGAVDVQGVSNTAHAMESFANSISGIGSLKFDTNTLTNIANSISRLGRASVTEATQNLEFLKTSMSDFVSGMNNVGSLNFNPDSLYKLVSSITRMGGKNATQSVKNLPQISSSLHSFVTSMNSIGGVTFYFEGLNSLVNNISRLGGAKSTQAAANLKPIKDQLLRFVSGLNGIGALNFDTGGLINLVSSITKLGGKTATAAIPNIQQLGAVLSQLMTTLSRAPVVSQNLIQMTNALASLSSNGSKVSSASQAMKNGLNSYSNSAGRAKDSTKSLASQIGMLYAKYFMLVRGVKGLWKATESSMDYIETLNYFDAAWGQVADNAVGSWKQSGYDSAEAYAKSFSERAKELTGKMSGFQADSNGNLVSTGMPSLGIDPDMLMNYQATFGQMASSMDVASETALKLSNALTMIGADLASVRNMDFKDVWQNLASGMVGMSETVDKYGVNIREANLQQKLSELGIKAKISALSQQDKVLLRTIIILDSTKYAWGDLANTLGQPSNQLRLLQSNFANLARTIGNLFLPIVATVLPYVNALVIAVQRLFSWIGGLLGIQIGSLGSSVGSAAADMSGLEDAAGGAADKMDDAANKSKKMASNLQGFDNLKL